MEDATLRNDIYELVYDEINSNKTWVSGTALYGGYPDVKNITYPCIILMPIDINEDSYTVDSTRNVSNKNIVVTIELYSKKNKDLDIISDGLTHLLRGKQFSGMFLTSIAENMQFISPNDLKIKSKILNFTYVRR